MDRQLEDGSWAQEDIEGIFNKNCAIVYPNVRLSLSVFLPFGLPRILGGGGKA
jgi:lanosterol synthase